MVGTKMYRNFFFLLSCDSVVFLFRDFVVCVLELKKKWPPAHKFLLALAVIEASFFLLPTQHSKGCTRTFEIGVRWSRGPYQRDAAPYVRWK
jgi:hypothetical protein